MTNISILTGSSRKATLPPPQTTQTEKKEVSQIEAKNLKIVKRIDGGLLGDDMVEVDFEISGKTYSGFIPTKTVSSSSISEKAACAVKKENKVVGYLQYKGGMTNQTLAFVFADGRVSKTAIGPGLGSKFYFGGKNVGYQNGDKIYDVLNKEIGTTSKDRYLIIYSNPNNDVDPILKNTVRTEAIAVVKYTDDLANKILSSK